MDSQTDEPIRVGLKLPPGLGTLVDDALAMVSTLGTIEAMKSLAKAVHDARLEPQVDLVTTGANNLIALQTICAPLRSMSTRLANAQKDVQETHPEAAENIRDVRVQLANITQVAYDALGSSLSAPPPQR